jgi:O-antigen/teichoic acid export membrane protein
MLTLSGIAQLNLQLGLGVLLPRAGRAAGRLLGEVYLTVTVVGLLLLGGFALVVAPHMGTAGALLHVAWMPLVFAAAVLAQNIFALQDSALAALRAARWIPIENILFGVAKVVLLVALARVLPGTGIFLSWVIPTVLAVLPVSTLLFRVVTPRLTAPPTGAVTLAAALRPVVGDYAGYLLMAASTLALPALAVALVGTGGGAVFAVAWLTSSTLDVLATNIGMALTVEGAHSGRVHHLQATVLRVGIPVVAVASAALIAVAPWLLKIYGEGYSRSGTLLLQLLALAAVPRALTVFALAAARARDLTRTIVRLQATSCLLVLAGMVVGTRVWGVTGLGAAWLIAQVVTAATALPHLLSSGKDPERAA